MRILVLLSRFVLTPRIATSMDATDSTGTTGTCKIQIKKILYLHLQNIGGYRFEATSKLQGSLNNLVLKIYARVFRVLLAP